MDILHLLLPPYEENFFCQMGIMRFVKYRLLVYISTISKSIYEFIKGSQYIICLKDAK